MIIYLDATMFFPTPCGDIAIFILFMEFMRIAHKTLKLFVEDK